MTICERCGAARPKIDDECPSCHFQPRTLRELTTAAVLTTEFDAGDKTYGTPQPTLDQIARDIQAGRPPVIDPYELERHRQTVEAFLAVTGWDLATTLAKFFAPALLLLASLLVVGLLLRACNHARKRRTGDHRTTTNLVMMPSNCGHNTRHSAECLGFGIVAKAIC